MKTNYLQKNSRWPIFKSRWILIGAIVVFLLLASSFIYFLFGGFGFLIGKSTKTGGGFLGAVGDYFISKKYLIDQNNKLIEKNEELMNQIRTSEAVALNYEAIKKELNNYENTEKAVLAGVLLKPPLSPYDTFIVDAGSKQNVSVGDKVFSSGAYIGEIIETRKNFSTAKLISSPNQEIQVQIHDQTFLAYGAGGGRFTVEVPKDIEVKIGDTVFLAGLNPKVVGVVGFIEAEDSGGFKKVFFNLPANLNKINFVLIFLNDSENNN